MITVKLRTLENETQKAKRKCEEIIGEENCKLLLTDIQKLKSYDFSQFEEWYKANIPPNYKAKHFIKKYYPNDSFPFECVYPNDLLILHKLVRKVDLRKKESLFQYNLSLYVILNLLRLAYGFSGKTKNILKSLHNLELVNCYIILSNLTSKIKEHKEKILGFGVYSEHFTVDIYNLGHTLGYLWGLERANTEDFSNAMLSHAGSVNRKRGHSERDKYLKKLCDMAEEEWEAGSDFFHNEMAELLLGLLKYKIINFPKEVKITKSSLTDKLKDIASKYDCVRGINSRKD